MKQIYLLIIYAASLILSGSAWAQSASETNLAPPVTIDFGPKEMLKIVSNGKTLNFMVEVADNQAELSHGMMFRDVVPENEGMLFEFGEARIASIWMKNTYVFLDVFFVRADGSILKIEHSATPRSLRSMTSEAPVTAVLEIGGGQANALGIRAGDILQHDYFGNAP